LILSDSSTVTNVALWSMVPFTVAFVFVVFVFYRSRREALLRQKEAELKQHMAEIEMKALRAQMNPHFIFNCMNSIYKFMHHQDVQSAGDYLVRFSKLIRTVLENSIHREVSLADDLTALELYIQMEQLRLNQTFDYSIEVDEKVNKQSALIPPLILQPFVENAIWHGLNNKKEKGFLCIKIERNDSVMKYSITDNGCVTEEKNCEENSAGSDLTATIKKTSLGSGLTRERIDLLNRTKGWNADFVETTLHDAAGNYSGRRIEIFLPYEEE
jgi:LytS/YehU family sensor histidine kinase